MGFMSYLIVDVCPEGDTHTTKRDSYSAIVCNTGCSYIYYKPATISIRTLT